MRVAKKLKVIDSARNLFTEYGKIICNVQKRGGGWGQRGVSGLGLI